MSYIESEFSRLIETDYNFKIQIYDGKGNKTKFLTITDYELKKIKNVLLALEKEDERNHMEAMKKEGML